MLPLNVGGEMEKNEKSGEGSMDRHNESLRGEQLLLYTIHYNNSTLCNHLGSYVQMPLVVKQ